MIWWWMLLAIVVTSAWCLTFVAEVCRTGAEQARLGVPENQRRGVSCAPVLPALPVGFWLVAFTIDRVAEPWGTAIVGSVHAVAVVVLLGLIGRSVWVQWGVERAKRNRCD